MNNDNPAGFATENIFENQRQTNTLTRTLYHTTQPHKVLMSWELYRAPTENTSNEASVGTILLLKYIVRFCLLAMFVRLNGGIKNSASTTFDSSKSYIAASNSQKISAIASSIIRVLCYYNFFWNQLFLWPVNMNICICPPPPIIKLTTATDLNNTGSLIRRQKWGQKITILEYQDGRHKTSG